ncbi:S8 family serine peptidase [Amycolatopsis suaedae]|uniref:Peptidase S8 n=1 Tax=Amycolatopsis suaedae TaxID=2510978 RepID=A0A4Q7JB85_9PSEU|nr:S8 family serine peptidase [Amycolatopsis suaedae]RZQ63504.1 peptidase S8 [Amycolatopsis suaedae]
MTIGRDAALVVTALVTTAVVPVAGGPPATGVPPVPGIEGSVTLLTGDRVTVRRIGPRLMPHVEAGPGRDRITFRTQQYTDATGEHLAVLPSDAVPLLGAGRLDERLFDVAGLLRQGYGDDRRADLPVLVQGDGADAAVRRAGTPVRDTVPAVGAVAARLAKHSLAGLWGGLIGPGVRKVWLDGRVPVRLDESVAQIGAPEAWRAGYTGKGVKVAVLDSGIDARHGDFDGRLAEVRDFTKTGPGDTVGHGTHVASILAGTGARSGGRFRGAAPDADLMIGKVCDGDTCAESAVLAGMTWAATSGADIVNLSLGGPDAPGRDLLEQTVDSLSEKYGLLFVVAAGNQGRYGDETVGSPATADAALAVGAVDKSDVLADFSGRGPRFGDAALKPDVTAPGVAITAARANRTHGQLGTAYTEKSGTSMAAPHVTAAAALLAQRHPDWPGSRLKAALMSSARPRDGVGGYAQGAGRIDAYRAVSQDVVADPGGVSAGRFAWPHDDDRPVDKPVTYHNAGSEPVTLALAVDSLDPTGSPAPAGMFTLSASSVTVPAGGSATVTVRVAPTTAGPDGHYTARIRASAGTIQVVTPVVADKEPESYTLTLLHTDRAGRPAEAYASFVYGIDHRRYRVFSGNSGRAEIRVLAGRYHLDATVYTGREGGTATLTQPVVDVTRDTTVVLDARQALPVAVTFDRAGVQPAVAGLGYLRRSAGGMLVTGLIANGFAGLFTGRSGPPVADGELIADIGGMWQVPGPGGDPAVTYHLQWFTYGQTPAGFARHVADDQLAEVRVRYGTQAEGRSGIRQWIGQEPTLGYGAGYGTGFRIPVTRTEFHNTDGLTWHGTFEQYRDSAGETELTGGPVDHEAGLRYTESWNTPVFGPGLPGTGPWVLRQGNQISARIPLFSDAATDRAGFSEVDSGRTALYRDGALVGEHSSAGQGSFDVPPEEASYRLETEAFRKDVSVLSTRTNVVWTFRSAHAAGWQPLPLLAVRLAPEGLDDHGAAPGGAPVPMAVTVQRQHGSPATPGPPAVAASYDDGRTWQDLPVTREADGYRVTVPQQPGAAFVSLRATAVDDAGNTVEQTTTRAFAL